MDDLFYTLVLRAGSYYIDADTRERVLRAQRMGATEVGITPVKTKNDCSCDRAVVVLIDDALGFIEHDSAREISPRQNVVPLRALAKARE